jgi:4-hydroxy-3-polyprenylbenzoate decarboxylase
MLTPKQREQGDMTHSVAIIDACRPFHWQDQFPMSNAPSPEVLKKAEEKFGYLMERR